MTMACREVKVSGAIWRLTGRGRFLNSCIFPARTIVIALDLSIQLNSLTHAYRRWHHSP